MIGALITAALCGVLTAGMTRLPLDEAGLFAGEERGPAGVLARALAAGITEASGDAGALAMGGAVALATALLGIGHGVLAAAALGLFGVVAAGDLRTRAVCDSLLPIGVFLAVWAAWTAGNGSQTLASGSLAALAGIVLLGLAGDRRWGLGDLQMLMAASLLVPLSLMPAWLGLIGGLALGIGGLTQRKRLQ